MRGCFQTDAAALLLGALLVLTLPLKWLLAAAGAAAVHEACHAVAVCLTGGQILHFRIGPRGAVMETASMSRGRELVCALAGPLGSAMVVSLFRVFPRTAACALAQGVFNLLPIFPLDGGRALRCAAELTFPKWADQICLWVERGTVAVLVMGAIAATFFLHLGILPLIITILLAFQRIGPCKPTRFGVQ